MSKNKKLYQKVDVSKSKRFGNQNTNSINIILNPDLEKEDDEMYNGNIMKRPRTSNQVIENIRKAQAGLPKNIAQQILSRNNRANTESSGGMTESQLNQVYSDMLRNQNVDTMRGDVINQMEEERQAQKDTEVQANLNNVEDIISQEENDRYESLLNDFQRIDQEQEIQRMENEAFRKVIVDGLKQELDSFEDRLTNEIREVALNQNYPSSEELLSPEIDKLEEIINELQEDIRTPIRTPPSQIQTPPAPAQVSPYERNVERMPQFSITDNFALGTDVMERARNIGRGRGRGRGNGKK